MKQYGEYKRGSAKIHPHDECAICSEKTISKKKERQKAKNECRIALEKYYNMEEDDVF